MDGGEPDANRSHFIRRAIRRPCRRLDRRPRVHQPDGVQVMTHEVEIYRPFMGHDANIRVEFEITHYGSPAVIDYVWGGDPAEDPEWEVNEIGVTLDLDEGPGAEWLPHWRERAFNVLANSPAVEQAIIDYINDMDRGRRSVWDDAA